MSMPPLQSPNAEKRTTYTSGGERILIFYVQGKARTNLISHPKKKRPNAYHNVSDRRFCAIRDARDLPCLPSTAIAPSSSSPHTKTFRILELKKGGCSIKRSKCNAAHCLCHSNNQKDGADKPHSNVIFISFSLPQSASSSSAHALCSTLPRLTGIVLDVRSGGLSTLGELHVDGGFAAPCLEAGGVS